MRTITLALFGLLVIGTAAAVQANDDIFILKSTDKTPEAVVEAVKAHSERMQWRYIGDSKVKKGEVTLVKVCIPAVGQAIWPAGLQLSALLPCGNLGIYRSGEVTEISLLHPRYMSVLYPHPATEEAGEVALPLLVEMLDAVTR
jgi:hypothetical protein